MPSWPKLPSRGCPRIVYPDMPEGDFCLEEWADELAESGAKEGLHVRNGYVLAVVRLDNGDGQSPFRRIAAKARAIEFLRAHDPSLPPKFKSICRTLVDSEEEDGSRLFVISFRILPGRFWEAGHIAPVNHPEGEKRTTGSGYP